jgi:hypothetical protein
MADERQVRDAARRSGMGTIETLDIKIVTSGARGWISGGEGLPRRFAIASCRGYWRTAAVRACRPWSSTKGLVQDRTAANASWRLSGDQPGSRRSVITHLEDLRTVWSHRSLRRLAATLPPSLALTSLVELFGALCRAPPGQGLRPRRQSRCAASSLRIFPRRPPARAPAGSKSPATIPAVQ